MLCPPGCFSWTRTFTKPSLETIAPATTAVPSSPIASFPKIIAVLLSPLPLRLLGFVLRIYPDPHALLRFLHRHQRHVPHFPQHPQRRRHVNVLRPVCNQRVHQLHRHRNFHPAVILAPGVLFVALLTVLPNVNHQVSTRLCHTYVLVRALHAHEFVVRSRANCFQQRAQIHVVVEVAVNPDFPIAQVSLMNRPQHLLRHRDGHVDAHRFPAVLVDHAHVQPALRRRRRQRHTGHAQHHRYCLNRSFHWVSPPRLSLSQDYAVAPGNVPRIPHPRRERLASQSQVLCPLDLHPQAHSSRSLRAIPGR